MAYTAKWQLTGSGSVRQSAARIFAPRPSPSESQIFHAALAVEYWAHAPYPNASMALATAESNLAWVAPHAPKLSRVQPPVYSEWRSLIPEFVEPLSGGRFLPPQATAKQRAALLAGYRKLLVETGQELPNAGCTVSEVMLRQNRRAPRPGDSGSAARLAGRCSAAAARLDRAAAFQIQHCGRRARTCFARRTIHRTN